MTSSQKPTSREELEHIEDALVRSILEASAQELREDLLDGNDNPEKLVAEIDAVIARAKADAAKKRLEQAKLEFAAWRAKSEGKLSTAPSQEVARKRFERVRAGDPEFTAKMTMAARKGEGLSERDFEGLVEDFADLERLEREDEGA